MKKERAIFASGCFWGTEFFLKKAPGTIETAPGYIGGRIDSPTYEQVCEGNTGHAEAVEVIFDAERTSFEDLLMLFFETHDFTQVGGVGPDIGDQYRSEVFYLSEEQKFITEKYIKILEEKDYKVSTKITKASEFFVAENYHKNYYYRTGGSPYCHIYKKIF